MVLLFVSPGTSPAPWLAALRAAMPGLDCRVWPEVGDPAAIDYALAWKPPPGLLASLPNLKAVFSLAAGVDTLLADPTLPAQVPVVRMVEPGLTEGMVEYVAWQVLAAHRRAHLYRAQQARGEWRPRRQPLARQRPVGILGMGEMGRAAAQALLALGFPVAGWSRSGTAPPGVAGFAGAAGLPPFLARSEILVCLLPLTPDTAGILDRRLFAGLPRGAFLVNAGRGGHLVEPDLLAVLESGQIGGAALDVFADEPLPPDHPFWRHPLVTVTPHNASDSVPETAAPVIAEGIRRREAGLPLDHVVDHARGY